MSRSLQDRLNADVGGLQLRVTGLRETLRALEQAGADAQDMKDLMHEVGEAIARPARAGMPVKSGKARNSIRAGRGKTKAVVRAGGARAPYVPVLEYGWPAHNIEEGGYVRGALTSNFMVALNVFENGLEDILKKNNLK